MKMSAGEFKKRLLEAVLGLLWRQWTQLGVAGHNTAVEHYVLDPEALLIFTAYFGRYDQRLFDEVMDWLGTNQRFMNVQRLRTLSRNASFPHQAVLGYIAAVLKAGDASLKWRKLAEDWKPEKYHTPNGLFILSSGMIMPVVGCTDKTALQYGFKRNPLRATGNSQNFPSTTIATLLLQLRGFFGINARSEVMLGLLSEDHCTIQEIAELSGFSWRSIQDVLFEMKHSNVVEATAAKKGRYYFLKNKEAVLKLFWTNASAVCFPDWLALYNMIAMIFSALCLPPLPQVSDLAFESVMREILTTQTEGLILNARFTEIKHVSWEKLEEFPLLVEQL